MSKKIYKIAFIAIAILLIVSHAQAQTLQGHVEEEDTRILRGGAQGNQNQTPGDALRLGRNAQPKTDSLIDTSAFTPPLAGRADNTQLNSGTVNSSDFANLPKNFDIGAERDSKEMVLAWERWHKQLAAAIYQLWNNRAKVPGRAVMRITIYRNRQIVPEFITASGSPEFRQIIMSVFQDLQGNPGLTFPAKSQREKVSFEAEYIAGTNVDPGYNWLKNDYEHIREDN